MSESRTLAVLVALGAMGGVLSVIIPYLAIHGYSGPHEYSSPLFPLLRNAWEILHPIPTDLLLLAVGGILGFVRPKKWLVLGSSTIILFPLAAILEMLKDPSSHNLWPIEFVFYIVLIGGPGLLGALLGSIIGSIQKKQAT